MTLRIKNEKKKLGFLNISNNSDPEYAKIFDSGFDLRAWIKEDDSYITLQPLERKLIHTGIYTLIPEDCEIQVRTRSGLALKKGLIVLNSPGTVDYGYGNEICVILINLSNEPYTIYNGDRIAQAVLMPVFNSEQVELNKLDNNEFKVQFELRTNESTKPESKIRGMTGFGDSGVK